MSDAASDAAVLDRTYDALSPRIQALREMYWNKTHAPYRRAQVIEGCGDASIAGHGRDFATLLDASEPQIQEHELLAGVALAWPGEGSTIDLGYYNRHYPPGHHNILRYGFAGIRDRAQKKLARETDAAKRDFLQGVAVAYDAACRYAERTSRYLRAEAGKAAAPRAVELADTADACLELANGPPTSFHAALQAVWFTFMFGGSGCTGRFDQWLWPFLERDLGDGRIAEAHAEELLRSLWIKLNFFAGNNDSLRNVSLAGQTPGGEEGCNPLTFMCIAATEALRLPEPKINVRFHKNSPRELLIASCRCLAKGLSQPAMYNDEITLPALAKAGVPVEDARYYCNDGCEEIIIGGKCASQFRVFDTLPVLNETLFRAATEPYETFDEVLADFKERLTRWMPDDRGQPQAVTHPFFAASIDDCLKEASPLGARYHITGNIIAQTANAADGLAAIKRLVFDEQAVTWDELIAAVRANYDGAETLRQMVLNRAPKFGNDDEEVDAIATDIAHFFLDGVMEHARNESGTGCKRVGGLMSFGLQSRRGLPATPDGRRQGDVTANSYSPAPGRDKAGPTAVLNSVGKLDATKAPFGATLDLALHTAGLDAPGGFEKLVGLVETFLSKPCCTTLQMNVVDRGTLLKAQADPTNPKYRTLIVRVWGFSAVFPELIPELQDHVIQRTEHAL